MTTQLRHDVREIYRYALLRYPTLYDCPLDVSCHLFTSIGGGFEWTEDGRLDYSCPRGNYERPEKEPETDIPSCLIGLRVGYMLEEQARQLKIKFIRDNLEFVLDSGPVTSFFQQGYMRRRHYVGEGICYEGVKAIAFRFPDNIQPQWAETLLEFMGWWVVSLRHLHHVGEREDEGKWAWWPKDTLKAYHCMVELKERLHVIVHGPRDPVKEAATKAIIDKILKARES